MPARRRRTVNKKTKRGNPWSFLGLFFLLGLIILFYLVISERKFWTGDSKISLVISNTDGSATVSVFDPTLKEITNITIPSNTEVEVAHQLGIWKLGSVSRLGENEGMGGGELLAATLRHQFKFPVAGWADSPAAGLGRGSAKGIIEALSGNYKTNLRIGDKIALSLFSLKVDNIKRNDINLSETPFLIKSTLKDGEDGYVVGKNFSPRLLSVFANDTVTRGSFQIEISDSSGDAEVAGDVGELMQVLGAKVASVVKKEASDFNCIVTGYPKSVVKEVSSILSCEQKVGKNGSFDLEIELGRNFVRTF